METRRSSASSPWERGFDLSCRFACEKLARISDIREQCQRSGARYVGPNEIGIDYLSQSYRIRIPDCRVSLEDSGIEASLRDRILILHYFTGAKGTAATGKLIAYRQLQGGLSYFPAFSQRVINPLVRSFGKSSELLRETAAKLGGCEVGYGDASVTINAFDRVPVTFVLWKGDEEVPANGNVLFDANVSDYLSTEDVTVLCETIIWKLVKNIPAS